MSKSIAFLSLERRIDALFARYTRPGSPGAVVAVAQGGEVEICKGYGLASIEHNVPIQRVVSHGNTVSVYARDPDGNSVEVYWPSGVDVPQPFGKPMDLTKSEPEIRDQLTQILREWEESKQR